ncbi:hypothetical protein [Cerasicoccus arenae]|nr:hypothetical protein [Cerasicoccus arenae]
MVQVANVNGDTYSEFEAAKAELKAAQDASEEAHIQLREQTKELSPEARREAVKEWEQERGPDRVELLRLKAQVKSLSLETSSRTFMPEAVVADATDEERDLIVARNAFEQARFNQREALRNASPEERRAAWKAFDRAHQIEIVELRAMITMAKGQRKSAQSAPAFSILDLPAGLSVAQTDRRVAEYNSDKAFFEWREQIKDFSPESRRNAVKTFEAAQAPQAE